MSTSSKNQETDQAKKSIFPIKDLYEITIEKIKDPILRTILAFGILLLGLSMIPQLDVIESLKWPLFLLGVIAALFGLIKLTMEVVFENGKEKELSELRRLLRPAKNVRISDLTQEMGVMIRDSSNEAFIIDIAQRMAKNSLKRMGKNVRLPDIPKLYETKGISHADYAKERQIVQAMVDEVSWKRHRVFVADDVGEQVIQYPSTMLLSGEIYGGCVDKVVLLCTLLRAVGFRVRFKTSMTKSEGWAHVWAEVCLPTKQAYYEWISIDPSRQSFQIGEKEDWERYWNDNFINRGFPPSESAESYEL